ncbi:MAG: hypothetical protein HFI08_04005 [Bacilli bacterium]|nr:hypothetical protein [Bacilli bacterium]
MDSVVFQGCELTFQEVIFLTSMLKREYYNLLFDFKNPKPYVFCANYAREQMICCLHLLSLVEGGSKKWKLELNLLKEQVNQGKDINA